MHRSIRSMPRVISSYLAVYTSPAAMWPWGRLQYSYLPHGVRYVVRWRSSSLRGTEWYPFQASMVVLMVLGGTLWHCRRGALVGWVCRRHAAFSFWKSTTLLGLPDFLATTCIGAHHSVGVPTATGRMTPMATSLSSPFFTSSAQCTATARCVWMAKGLALGSTYSWQGLPSMTARG